MNTTLYINIEYEFVGKVMFNPLILNQAQNFGSVIFGIATNLNFLDGIIKSFLFTSGISATVSAVLRIIKITVAKITVDAIQTEK